MNKPELLKGEIILAATTSPYYLSVVTNLGRTFIYNAPSNTWKLGAPLEREEE